MKAGYTVNNIGYQGNYNFIEVVNYFDANSVFNFTWASYDSCRNISDGNTVGVWKIKKK